MNNSTNPLPQNSDIPTITGNEPVADVSFAPAILQENADLPKTEGVFQESTIEETVANTPEIPLPEITDSDLGISKTEIGVEPDVEGLEKIAAQIKPPTTPQKNEQKTPEEPPVPVKIPEPETAMPATGSETKNITEESVPMKRPEPLIMPRSPVIPEAPKPTEKPSSIWAIRTYKSDVAASVRGNKTSLSHMVLAEENRRRDMIELSSPKSTKNILLITISVLLVLSGGAGAAYMFYKSMEPKTVSVVPQNQPLLFAENLKIVEVTGKSSDQLAKLIRTEIETANNKLDTMENVFFTETVNGTPAAVPAGRFFTFLDSRMPPELSRSLDANFMFGIHTFNGNHPFLVFHTNYYENSFAGMLGWEQYMARDLFPIFAVKEGATGPIYDRAFADATIKNRDVRELKNDSGEVVLFYTFTDKKTLVITNASDTLEEVIRRLNSSAPVTR